LTATDHFQLDQILLRQTHFLRLAAAATTTT